MTHRILDVHLKPRCKGVHIEIKVPVSDPNPYCTDTAYILDALYELGFIKFEITGEEVVHGKTESTAKG